MKLNIGAWTRIRTAYAYRQEPEHLRELAAYFWRILLCTGAVIIACAAWYGAFRLSSVLEGAENRSAKAYSSGTGTSLLDRTQLQATLDNFTERGIEYERLKTNPPAIADPSR
jgi:hypothetical protein